LSGILSELFNIEIRVQIKTPQVVYALCYDCCRPSLLRNGISDYEHCLHFLSSDDLLQKHLKDFIQINGTQAIEMPGKGSKIYFKNHPKLLPVPFVIYADFEAITEKIDSCLPPNGNSCTQTYQSHQACGFGYKVVCYYDKRYSEPVEIYPGEDAVEKFLEKMIEEVESCKNIMRKYFKIPLKMTVKDERDFQEYYMLYL